jgi:hypothetical protein
MDKTPLGVNRKIREKEERSLGFLGAFFGQTVAYRLC